MCIVELKTEHGNILLVLLKFSTKHWNICHRVIIRVWKKVLWENLSCYEEGEGSEGEHVERRTISIIAAAGLRRHARKCLLDIHDRGVGQLKE